MGKCSSSKVSAQRYQPIRRSYPRRGVGRRRRKKSSRRPLRGSLLLIACLSNTQPFFRFAARIKQDQEAVLNPDVDTPFQDEADVVKRLLPYHIFQQPKEDLETVAYGKGKGKASEYDLKTELEDTKFAIECHKRQEKLRVRWRNIKIRQGEVSRPVCFLKLSLIFGREHPQTPRRMCLHKSCLRRIAPRPPR